MGVYGSEVVDVIIGFIVFDCEIGEVEWWDLQWCGFGFCISAFKYIMCFVVFDVMFWFY